MLDSYVTVKLNEALYEMKEQLQETERHAKRVIKEKERLERVLQEKVQLIRVHYNTLSFRENFAFSLVETSHKKLTHEKYNYTAMINELVCASPHPDR